MARIRTKANIWDLVNNDIIFYDSFRAKVDNIRGCMFKCCEFLTDDQKAILKQFKNVKIYKGFCRYAPELKTNIVFIADKNF